MLCILTRKLYATQLVDISSRPTISEFLAFIKKRALALENADLSYGQNRQQPSREVKGTTGILWQTCNSLSNTGTCTCTVSLYSYVLILRSLSKYCFIIIILMYLHYIASLYVHCNAV